MIITGYVYSLSLDKQNAQHLEDAFPWKTILKRMTRYTLPLIGVIIWELFDPHFATSGDLLERVRWAINGTVGKGHYYYPVMMQLVFVFPLIYFVIEKQREKGLFICFIANAVYEILCWSYGIPTGSYRLLMFRYVFVVAAGAYAFKCHRLPIWLSILMTTIGVTFITAVIYTGYECRIVNNDWAATNFIASMLIIPLMIWVLQNLKIRSTLLEFIGKASYHIFLVQMVYYAGYYTVLKKIVSLWQLHFIIGIILCLVLGAVFYYAEKPLQDGIVRLISKLCIIKKETV